MTTQPANDNSRQFYRTIDRAIPGQEISMRAPHRKFGQCYGEFIGHAGDGKHIIVSKRISNLWNCRYTKPMKIARTDVIGVHGYMSRKDR